MKKKMIAMITTALLCTVLGGNAVFASSPSVKAELTNSNQKVETTCTSSGSETYKLVVSGYERNSFSGIYYPYEQTVTLMGSGTITANHNATTGRVFVPSNDNMKLMEYVYLGSRNMGLYATILL